MKSYSIRELDKKLSAALKELPFLITNHNIPYAQVIPVEKTDTSVVIKNVQTLESKPEVKEENVPTFKPDPVIKYDSDYRPSPKPSQVTTIENMIKVGKCIFPGCKGEGSYHPELEFWDDALGEMRPKPGFLCKTHERKLK